MSSALHTAEVRCSKCQSPLLDAFATTPGLDACPTCRSPLMIRLFPAIYRRSRLAGTRAEEVVGEGESTCFYHSPKKASTPCGYCGRFLCSVCDVEIEGRHWCPPCLEAATEQNRLPSLIRRRTLYDSIALSLAVFPMLLIYLSFIGAPAALFVGIYYRNAPTSLLGRSRARLIIAIALAALQILGWISMIFFIIMAVRES